MLTQQQIALLILRARAYHLQLVRALCDKERQGDVQSSAWNRPIIIGNAIAALYFSLKIADYSSAVVLQVYNNLLRCIGSNVLGNLVTDPNAQLPGNNVPIVTGGGTGGGSVINSGIIEFNIDIVELLDYQNNFKPAYGNDAEITIWTINDNGIGYTQDTGTVPTKQFVDNDPTKDLLSVTWTYPVVTKGYIQIVGVNASASGGGGGSGGGGVVPALPITNLSFVLLNNATLNGLYPTAQWQQLVLLPKVPAKYLKLDNSPTGLWELQPYTPNS